MSLKTTIVIIALIAIVSLVGVGFATWTFTTPTDGDVGVTAGAYAAIEADNVEVTTADGLTTIDTLYIICDQPSTGHGIFWSTTNDSTAFANQITQIKLIGSVNEDDNDILDFIKYTGTFTCSFDGDDTLTYFDVPAIDIDEDVTSTGKDTTVEYLYTLPSLTYKDTPESVDEVNEMLTAVNDLSITITFSFKVKEVVTE